MGFCSEWMRIFKHCCPRAFSMQPDAPNLKGVFIDGHIQLMKGSYVTTMDMFYQLQFASVVNRYFQKRDPAYDDLVVVVGFDNYTCVPTAKSMTQAKRACSKKEPPMIFTETDKLPEGHCPPNWDAAMKNRTFKNKLIKRVVEKLGELVILRDRQRCPPNTHIAAEREREKVADFIQTHTHTRTYMRK